jgi:hypothetical protein
VLIGIMMTSKLEMIFDLNSNLDTTYFQLNFIHLHSLCITTFNRVWYRKLVIISTVFQRAQSVLLEIEVRKRARWKMIDEEL